MGTHRLAVYCSIHAHETQLREMGKETFFFVFFFFFFFLFSIVERGTLLHRLEVGRKLDTGRWIRVPIGERQLVIESAFILSNVSSRSDLSENARKFSARERFTAAESFPRRISSTLSG